MAVDFSKLSDADLAAISKGDMAKVSDEGLTHLAAAPVPDQSNLPPGERKPYVDPLPTMMDLLKASVVQGRRWADLAAKGINSGVVHTATLPSDATTAIINKVTGRTDPSLGDRWDQASNADIAPATNPVEKAVELAGGFLGGSKIPLPGAVSAPASQLANSTAAARAAGYVMPASSVKPTVMNRLVESLIGKKELAGEATQRNLSTLSDNLAAHFNLPKGTEITHDTMDAVRANAGQAYDAIAQLGPQFAAQIQKIKELRNLSSKFFKQTSANYSVEAEQQANQLWEQAQALDAQLGKAVQSRLYATRSVTGEPAQLFDAYQQARKTIAQTHDVDKAIVNSRGELTAGTFANAYAKEKPLSGDLLTAGQSAQAFKPAFTTATGSPLSFTDKALLGSGTGLYAMFHDPKYLAAGIGGAAGQHLLRRAALSNVLQDMALLSPEQKKAALAQALIRGNAASQLSQEQP